MVALLSACASSGAGGDGGNARGDRGDPGGGGARADGETIGAVDMRGDGDGSDTVDVPAETTPDLPAETASDAPAQCAPPILNPDQTLTGYTLSSPEQKMGNPRASEPTYAYLLNGRDALVLTGAPVPDDGRPFVLRNPSIASVPVQGFTSVVYRVVVNDDLAYAVTIDDFELEVVLARVDLCHTAGSIESRFVFAAPLMADGIAQMVTIRAVINGVPATTTSTPVTIETRPF